MILLVFLNEEKAYEHVPQGALWGSLWKNGILESLLQVIQTRYDQSESCVWHSLGTKSNMYSVGIGFCKGYSLTQVLFVIFINRISKRVPSLGNSALSLFADDIVLLASSATNFSMHWAAFQLKMKRLGWEPAPPSETVDCSLQIGCNLLPQVSETLIVLGPVQEWQGEKKEHEMTMQFGSESAGTVPDQKAKLYQSINVSTLTYGHGLRLMKERTRSGGVTVCMHL